MSLQSTLARHFQTTTEFVDDTLRRRVKSDISGVTNLPSLQKAATPSEYKAAHYTLNSNLRGKKVVELAKRHGIIPPHAERALDIGAGYGGLTAALSDYGMSAIGLELDASYVEMAKKNLKGRNADIRVGDVLEVDPETLGKFDFITCIAVIEHVADAQKLLDRISALLNPWGAALVQSPNHRAIENVIGDIHHRVFGVQLLAYSAAQRSHSFDFPKQDAYTIGEMFNLGRYLLMMERAGLEARKLPYDAPIPSEQKLLQDLSELAAKSAELAASDHYDWFLRTELVQKCAAYIAEYSAGLNSFTMDGGKDFLERFVEPVWTFAVSKP